MSRKGGQRRLVGSTELPPPASHFPLERPCGGKADPLGGAARRVERTQSTSFHTTRHYALDTAGRPRLDRSGEPRCSTARTADCPRGDGPEPRATVFGPGPRYSQQVHRPPESQRAGDAAYSCVDALFCSRHLLIDGHVDTPYVIRHLGERPLEVLPELATGMAGHVDFPRLRAGGVGGCALSLILICHFALHTYNRPADLQTLSCSLRTLRRGTNRSRLPAAYERTFILLVCDLPKKSGTHSPSRLQSVEWALESVDLVHRMVELYPDVSQNLPTKSSEVCRTSS